MEGGANRREKQASWRPPPTKLRHATLPAAAATCTGFALAAAAGPRYQVTREVDLPDGSMWIPDPDNVQVRRGVRRLGGALLGSC